MRVTRVRLENYKGFKSFEHSFNPGINVLFGANGSGKTSTLRAIVTILSWYISRIKTATGSGKSITIDSIHNEENQASIILETEADQLQQTVLIKKRNGRETGAKSNLADLSKWATTYRLRRASGEKIIYPLFAFYGVHRAVLDIPIRIRGKFNPEPLQGYEQALDGGSNFRAFFQWFRWREDIENEEKNDTPQYRDRDLECVRNAWAVFMPELSNFRIRRRHQALTAIKDGIELSISQLSDGEKCLLALVGDIARRISLLHMESSEDASTLLKNATGIILIDELDLHLHPRWQRRAIIGLSEVFPNIQFIISTHSPSIISELPAEQLINLEQPDSGNYGFGLSVAEVSEHVMQAELWPKAIKQIIDKVESSISNEDAKSAANALSELKQLLPADAPIITELETEINLFV
ncbi:MAG: AAA family ATPase [Akkermansia sp.]|nr:AAA family ATPase [Akkermansia sp.]